MPTFARKSLRQTIAQLFDAKTWVGTTAGSIGANGSVFFIDQQNANPAFSGERLYDRAWLYHPDTQQTFRVASFNAASGAWVTAQTTSTTIQSGSTFEVHPRLSPVQLHQCMERTVARFRARQEVAINAIDAAMQYPMDVAASPATIRKTLNVFYYARPTATDNRDKRYFRWWGPHITASGTSELQVDPPVASGAQIVIDAIVDMTLGAAETATLNLPDDMWLHSGALMHAYNLLIQQAPGQSAGELAARRAEWGHQFRQFHANYMPLIDRSIGGAFDENPVNRGRL